MSDFEERERFFNSEKFENFVEDHKDIVTNGSVWDETKAVKGESLEGFTGLFDRILSQVKIVLISDLLKKDKHKEALSIHNMNLQEFNVWRKKQGL